MNKRTRIKICGLSSVEQALVAAEGGADAIGLVFFEKSPRAIDVSVAQEVCLALPAFVNRVALFVDPSEQEVKNVLARVQVDTLQFHGHESPEFCESFGSPYLKALSIEEIAKGDDYKSASALLIDNYDPVSIGGTGESFDWSLLPQDLAQKVILAGGLDATNVARAVTQLKPYGVDVSSGVEELDIDGNTIKGKKDLKRIAEFIAAVQDADASNR